MESLCPHPQRLRKILGANRHNHKFLKIHIVVGMLSAVDNIHHRNRQNIGTAAA